MNLMKCLVFVQFSFCIALAFDCIGEDGSSVDWWYIYKLPDVSYSYYAEYNSGLEYLYADSDNPELSKASDRLINSTESAFGRTANQYFQSTDKQNFGYFFYNDEHVNRSYNWSWGHTKGFGIFDSDGGIFVPHSVPKFPPTLEKFEYPDNAKKYGQNLFCFSLQLTDFDKLGKAFLYTHPYFFQERNIPEDLKGELPSLASAFQEKVNHAEPYYNIQSSFTRVEGLPFTIFAKSSQYGKDIVSGLMAPHLKSKLISETWEHSSKTLSPYCSGEYHVDMVTKINISYYKIFYNSDDHSKWAVSDGAYFCSGDINRVETQFTRGGLYVCMELQSLNDNVKSIIGGYDGCSSS